jgi:hypothetical protein
LPKAKKGNTRSFTTEFFCFQKRAKNSEIQASIFVLTGKLMKRIREEKFHNFVFFCLTKKLTHSERVSTKAPTSLAP